MADNQTRVKKRFCPSCFRRGLEQDLRIDPRNGEHYCLKCPWVGTRNQADEEMAAFLASEYKAMAARDCER